MCLDCECSMTSSLLKGPGQVMSDFNSHSHRLASLAFWRPIKPDSSPLSLAEGMLKAGKEQLSGMLKSFMMESVNSTNGSLSPCCLVHFISRKSRWQKLYWTLTVSPHILFCSFEKHLYEDSVRLSVKFGPENDNKSQVGNTCQNPESHCLPVVSLLGSSFSPSP